MAIVRLSAADLKQALETGGLSVHYQPQVVIATGKLAGVEAFVRWPHAVYGMLGPSDIIPVVDQAGLQVEFGARRFGGLTRSGLSRPSPRPESTPGPSSSSARGDRRWIRG